MWRHAVIAESDSALAELYRICLRREGYEVHLASNGQQCWDHLCAVQPVVLLLEWELCSGGGDGILGRLRDEWSGPTIHVIVTTTGDPDDIRSSGADGFATLLRKPFALASLKSSLEMGALQRLALRVGDPVRIARGPLEGMQAVLKSCEGDLWLIEPVMTQAGVYCRVPPGWLEPAARPNSAGVEPRRDRMRRRPEQ